MPRSWRESSSEKTNCPDSSPNKKLLTMNVRSSWVSVSMGPWGETVDETVHDDLRREDADQGHVVLDADRLAVTEFLNEPADCVGVEDAILAHLGVREQVVEISRPIASEE